MEHLNRLMFCGRISELKRLDLNAHQINTLFLLEYFGPLKMSAIAGELGTSIAHTTIIVKNLVSKKHVKRRSDPNDRRLIICEITAHGRKATEAFLSHARKRTVLIAEKWGAMTLESVVKSLELLWQTEDKILKSVQSSNDRSRES